MNLSKKCRYGIKAMVDLAIHSKEQRVALYSIAERNDISPQYLEQVFSALKKAGLVKSIKGAQGGYYLAAKASDITLDMIVKAVEGDYLLDDEAVNPSTNGWEISSAIQDVMIKKLNARIKSVLENTYLSDLEDAYYEVANEATDMYYI